MRVSKKPEVNAPSQRGAEPTPAVVDQEPPQTKTMLQISSVPEQGFWRLGRKWTKAPALLDPTSISDAQTAELELAEEMKLLVIKLIEVPA